MARYPSRPHIHQYGNLVVTVRHQSGEYRATVRRPSDGFEVTIGTPERGPMSAARFALQWLTDLYRNPSAESELRSAAQELGQDASEAITELDELDESEESPKLSGPYDESGQHREGDVWFQVVHEPKNLKPGQWMTMPFRGRKFRTKEDAEEALFLLLEQGTIKPDEKDQWGVERCRQGKGRTEVGHVRVS